MSHMNHLLFAIVFVGLTACDRPSDAPDLGADGDVAVPEDASVPKGADASAPRRQSFEELVYERTDAFFETCIPTGTIEVRVTKGAEGVFTLASTTQEIARDDECDVAQCIVRETRPPRSLTDEELVAIERGLATMGTECEEVGNCDSCPNPVFTVDGEFHPMPCCEDDDPYQVAFYALGELLVELAEQ